jgi:hypothetical protein
MKNTRQWGWAGSEGDRLRINKRKLVAFATRIGATVEDDSAGRWTVLQIIAPAGQLWSEGIRMIRVEWTTGESSEPACRDAYSRISSMSPYFRPMTERETDFYSET